MIKQTVKTVFDVGDEQLLFSCIVDYHEPGYIEVSVPSIAIPGYNVWVPYPEDRVPEEWYPELEQQAAEALAERDEGLRDLANDAKILARKEGE